METEAKIVYSIINTVNKGAANDDNPISERVVRSFLATYRSEFINKQSYEGISVSEECFQNFGNITLSYMAPRQYTVDLPKFIRLKDNFGLIVEKYGNNIPVVSSESYGLAMKSLFNKFIPKAKLLGSKLVVFIGKKKSTCSGAEGLNEFVEFFEQDIVENANKITVEVSGILDNPDDAIGYDWTVDPYPFPSELVSAMVLSILKNQYGIILRINTDDISDGEDEQNPQQ